MIRKLKLLTMVFATAGVVVGVAVAASSPSISTGPVSSVTESSAILHGAVNPNGASTVYAFDYGLTTGYGFTTSATSAGRGVKTVSVAATAGGLLPGTVYHYRLVALNKSGGATGADRTFKTHGNPPPDAATGGTFQLGTNFATVSGVINPHGEATGWAFQFGLTPSLGYQTLGGVVPAGNAPVTVAQQLVGLQAGGLFYYRIVAYHGTTVTQYGNELTFLTYPSPHPHPRVPARTTPHHARTAPFVFTTSGRVIGPSFIPQALACFPNVTVRFFFGTREVASGLFPVLPDCSFTGQTVISRLPGHGSRHRLVRLRVVVHYRGSGYLAPTDARPQTVVLGG
jgi:hypothetical protein